MRRRAKVRISLDMLAQLLHLRSGIAITSVEFSATTELVEVFMDGPDFPPSHKFAECPAIRLAELMDHEVMP